MIRSRFSVQKFRASLCVVFICLTSMASSSGNLLNMRAGAQTKQSDRVIYRAIEWLKAVEQHSPGEADGSAIVIGSWLDGLDVIKYIIRLATFKEARIPLDSDLQLAWSDASRLQFFVGNLNNQLKRGALLHSDIAMLGLNKGWSGSSSPLKIKVDDGRGALESGMVHWDIARALLNLITPSPSRDDAVRQWYIATNAYLLARRKWGDAETNLSRALQLFPADAKLQFYAGIVHENYASPESQSIRMEWTRARLDSKESELKKARDYFRKSIECGPSAEVRLHLGRVMALLGAHEAAAAELSQAAAQLTDRQLQYYCSLFLGNELAELNREEPARREFERAAALYPAAQSPLFGLSHLARSGGDLSGAAAAVQRVFELTAGGWLPQDPWWFYDVSHVRDLSALMSAMYKSLETPQ